MLRIHRILRDYENAGSLNSLIALWGFVDDHTFLTKAGHLGVVYRLAGVDFECLDHAQRRDVVHRYEAALRCLDESCRVYQYLSKRRMPPIVPAPCRQPVVHEAVHRRAAYLNGRRNDLFELELHLVLVYEGLRPHRSVERRLRGLWAEPGAAFRQWLSPRATLALVEADLDRALAHLHQKANAFEVQLTDSVRPTRLHKTDAFQFFRHLVNYSPRLVAGAALQYDTHLDYFIADSALDCHRDHLELDAARVKVLTMKEPPSATFPQVLEDLYTLPGEFIACLEWCRIPNDRMRRTLQLRRRHFFNKRVSMVNYVSPETRPDETIADDDRIVLIEETSEVVIDKPNLVRFEARRAQVALGQETPVPAVTIAELLRATLRHRPDRILVGEVRGAEAFDLLQALNTGHLGSLSTLHANSAEQALTRFAHCVLTANVGLPHMSIREAIALAIHLVVHIARDGGRRRVTQLVAVRGYSPQTDTFSLTTLYPEGGTS
jgi:Type II/IV secretion system protein